jgi:hypothetical protein
MSQLKWLLFASVLTVAFVLACGSADEATPVPATATSPPLPQPQPRLQLPHLRRPRPQLPYPRRPVKRSHP